jgi:hypothetical protein
MKSGSLPSTRTATGRARDVLARASSAHVTWLDRPERPSGRIAGVVIDTTLASAKGLAPCTVELADPSPLPVRDRIRARLRVNGAGAFDLHTEGLLRIHPYAVELETAGRRMPIDPAALAITPADPFAEAEGAFLSHLAECHPAALDALRRRLPSELQRARVVPVALDRFGIVLRVEQAGVDRDVAIDFASPVGPGGDLRTELQALLLTSPPAPRQPAPGGIAHLLRHGRAAARICDPAGE